MHIKVPYTFIYYLLGVVFGSLLTVSITLTAVIHHHTAWPVGIFFGVIGLFFCGLFSALVE